jgi:hypothetical protein
VQPGKIKIKGKVRAKKRGEKKRVEVKHAFFIKMKKVLFSVVT